jgi:hypothetical protein
MRHVDFGFKAKPNLDPYLRQVLIEPSSKGFEGLRIWVDL